jgi:hypothetical protein
MVRSSFGARVAHVPAAAAIFSARKQFVRLKR